MVRMESSDGVPDDRYRLFSLGVVAILVLGAGCTSAEDHSRLSVPDTMPQNSVQRLGTSVLRHNARVMAVVFGNDHSTLLSTGLDGALRIWSPGGVQVHPTSGNTSSAGVLAVTADGKLCATLSDSVHLDLRSVETGLVVRSIALEDGALCAGLTSDARMLIVGTRRNVINVYDPETGADLASIKANTPFFTVIPGTHLIACRGLTTPSIDVYDLNTNAHVNNMEPDGIPWTVVASATGSLVACCTNLGTTCVWDTCSWELVSSFCEGPGREAAPYGVVIHPSGTCLLSGHTGVRMWDLSSRTVRTSMESSTAADGAYLALSQDGAVVASWGRDQCIRLWSSESGSELTTRPTHRKGIAAIASERTGTHLASGASDGSICIWRLADDCRTLKSVSALSVEGEVFCVSFSPDSERIAVGRASGKLNVLESATGTTLACLPVATQKRVGQPLYGVAWCADSRTLLLPVAGRIVRWDTSSDTLTETETSHGAVVTGVSASPDGTILASIDDQGTLFLTRTETGRTLARVGVQTGVSYRLCAPLVFSGDSRLLVVATDRGSLVVIEVATCQLRATLEAHRSHISSLASHPCRQWLVSSSWQDGRSAVLDLITQRTLCAIPNETTAPPVVGYPDPVARTTCATFVGSRGIVVTGLTDTSCLVWCVQDKSPDHRSGVGEGRVHALKKAWDELASTDAESAGRAVQMLASDGEAAVAVLSQHLVRREILSQEEIPMLIAGLSSEEFSEREQASRDLQALYVSVVPSLREALANTADAEVKTRLQGIITATEEPLIRVESVLQIARAIEVLEHVGSDSARRVLEDLSRGPTGLRETLLAEAALRRVCGDSNR